LGLPIRHTVAAIPDRKLLVRLRQVSWIWLVSGRAAGMRADMSMLALAAAQPTALQKLQKIPPEFWIKVGIVIGAIMLIVLVLRKLAHVNKMIAAVAVLIAVMAIGVSWIYNRNEPAWATPVVEKLAIFLPTKGAYNAKQSAPLKQ